MTDSQTPTYRSHTTPPGDSIEYRAPEEDAEVFKVRMPIATTGEVRNEGDDPLTRDELDGMARQINDGGLGVFLDHGGSSLGGPQRYSAVGKIGEWTDATVDGERDDGTDALMATARIMDPEPMPAGVKELRAAVGAIHEQVKRGFSVASSIGWREDDSYPGGNDLMEASIVGIGADPRTTSQATDDAGLVARAAVDAGADPEALLESVRDAVESERPLGPPEDPDRFDTFEECVSSLAEDGDLSEEEAERICGAWEEAKEQSMTDDDTPDEGGTTDEEQTAPDEGDEETERAEAPEWASDIRDLLESIHEAVREDDMDDDEDDEDEQEMDDDEEEDEDEEDMEQSADSDDTDERIAELEEELEKVRNGELDVETPDDDTEPSAEQEADDVSSDTTDDWRKHAHN